MGTAGANAAIPAERHADPDGSGTGAGATGSATGSDGPSTSAAHDDGGAASGSAFRVALGVAVAAVVGVGVKGAVTGWQPIGDEGYFALRSHDVFTMHPPLLGTASSASMYTGKALTHPGPLQFDLLAVPVRIFGVAAGTAIGTAALNAASIAAVGLLLRRWAGAAAGLVGVTAMALLAWSLGGVVVHDPYGPYAVIMPFAVLLTATAVSMSGGLWALPVVALTGSLALQTHLSYVVLVPGLSALALAGAAADLWRRRRTDPAGWPATRRRAMRWAAATAVVAVLCWLQPLGQQVFGEDGNLGNLVTAAGADGPTTPSARLAIRSMSGLVAQPPLWLPPSYGSPLPLEASVPADARFPLATGSLGLVVAALVASAVAGRRRSDGVVVAAATTALAGLALGLVTIMRAPWYGVGGWTYVRWLWPLSLWVWVTLALAALRLAPAPVRAVARSRPALAALAAVCLIAGVGTLPASDNGGVAERERWQVTSDALVSAAVEAVGDERPVLVDYVSNRAGPTFGPAIMARLADEGIPFVVDRPSLARQVGFHRLLPDDDQAPVSLVLTDDIGAVPANGELVFHAPGLTPGEQARYDEAAAALDRLNARDGVHLTAEARAVLDMLDARDGRLPAEARAALDALAGGRLPDVAEAVAEAFEQRTVTFLDLGVVDVAARVAGAQRSGSGDELTIVDPDQLSPDLVRDGIRLEMLQDQFEAALFVVRSP
jgi:hypothetical protein